MVAPQLPEADTLLVACTVADVPSIPGEPGSPLTNEQAATSLGEQRSSALEKDRCARSWLQFYSDLRDRLANGE